MPLTVRATVDQDQAPDALVHVAGLDTTTAPALKRAPSAPVHVVGLSIFEADDRKAGGILLTPDEAEQVAAKLFHSAAVARYADGLGGRPWLTQDRLSELATWVRPFFLVGQDRRRNAMRLASRLIPLNLRETR